MTSKPLIVQDIGMAWCSTALLGYSLEALVDVWSSVLVLWRFWKDPDGEGSYFLVTQRRESRASVGISFTFVIIGYITCWQVRGLASFGSLVQTVVCKRLQMTSHFGVYLVGSRMIGKISDGRLDMWSVPQSTQPAHVSARAARKGFRSDSCIKWEVRPHGVTSCNTLKRYVC
jgi:hypothetical protein